MPCSLCPLFVMVKVRLVVKRLRRFILVRLMSLRVTQTLLRFLLIVVMSYVVTEPSQYQYLAAAWAQPLDLINLCSSALGQHFQTQAGRDVTREQFSNILQVVVSPSLRFPETGHRVFLLTPALKSVYESLMASFDTKNRIIEKEEEVRPSSSEVATAVRRVDDATVAIRSQVQALLSAVQTGVGFYDRTSFERLIPWTVPAAASAAGS
uniref:Capsid protein n=3 Tax=Ullucus tobamovirus 1 TaxID=2491948 RepID=A0A3G8FWM2_9VIRU|nr:orf4 [Ullucus tobamovirus 1]